MNNYMQPECFRGIAILKGIVKFKSQTNILIE